MTHDTPDLVISRARLATGNRPTNFRCATLLAEARRATCTIQLADKLRVSLVNFVFTCLLDCNM